MKRFSVRWALLGLATAVALPVASIGATGALAAGSFTNGGFQLAGDASPGSFTTICSGSPSAGNITGWTVTSGSVDVIGSYWTNNDSTTNSLDMNGTPNNCTGTAASVAAGTISQTFATVLNDTYFVSFELAGNPTNADFSPYYCSSAIPKTLSVDASGGTAASYTFDTSSTSTSAMGWETEGYSFIASGDTTTLTFAGDPTNTSYCGPALEDVTVTPTAPTGAACKDGGWASLYDPSTELPFKNQGDCVSYFATSHEVPIGA